MVENRSDIVILGDKGYVGENHAQGMEEQGICLMALKCSNSKTDLAQICPAVDFQTEETGRNRIFTVKWAVKCRKSACEKFSGVMHAPC